MLIIHLNINCFPSKSRKIMMKAFFYFDKLGQPKQIIFSGQNQGETEFQKKLCLGVTKTVL